MLDWMTDYGHSATVRYEVPGGGVIGLTQTLIAAGEEADIGAHSLAPIAAPTPDPAQMIVMVWQEGERMFELRAQGVSEHTAKEWIRSLAPAATCSMES